MPLQSQPYCICMLTNVDCITDKFARYRAFRQLPNSAKSVSLRTGSEHIRSKYNVKVCPRIKLTLNKCSIFNDNFQHPYHFDIIMIHIVWLYVCRNAISNRSTACKYIMVKAFTRAISRGGSRRDISSLDTYISISRISLSINAYMYILDELKLLLSVFFLKS